MPKTSRCVHREQSRWHPQIMHFMQIWQCNLLRRIVSKYAYPRSLATSHQAKILNLLASTTAASPIPANYIGGLGDPNWRTGMAEEFQALVDNDTWHLIPQPPSANIVTSKWIFKQKYHTDSTLARQIGWSVASTNATTSTTMRPSATPSSQQ